MRCDDDAIIIEQIYACYLLMINIRIINSLFSIYSWVQMFYIHYIIYEFKTIKDIVYIKFIFLIQQYISKCGIPSYHHATTT